MQFRTQGGNQKNAKRLDNRRSENDSLTENNREIKHVIATSEGWKIPHKYTLTAAVICKYKSKLLNCSNNFSQRYLSKHS